MALSRVARAATAVVTVACAVGIVLAAPVEAAWPGANGKIVFFKVDTSNPAPAAQIYSMNSNGQHQINLSAAAGRSTGVSLSRPSRASATSFCRAA